MEKRRIFRMFLPAIAAVVLMATAVGSYAWLKMDKGDSLHLGADNTPDVSVAMATYDKVQKQYVWGGFQTVEPTHEKADAYGAVFNMNKDDPNTHFGEINNLTTIDASNCAWFCVRIHEEEGLTFQNLKVQYAEGRGYDFYGSYWNNGSVQGIYAEEKHPQAADVTAALQKVNSDSVMPKLMHVAAAGKYFVTNVPPVQFFGKFPGAMTLTNPPVSSTMKDNIRLSTDQTDGKLAGTATVNELDESGYYYVYFRVWPDLQQYYEFVKHLYQFMPCYLSFGNLTVSVDVTTE